MDDDDGQEEPRRKAKQRRSCSFCTLSTPSGMRHDLCPGRIDGAVAGRKVPWTCPCAQSGHIA